MEAQFEDVKGSNALVRSLNHSTSVSLSRHLRIPSRLGESDNRDNKKMKRNSRLYSSRKGEQALPKPLVEEMKSTDGRGQWHEHQLFCRL